MKSRSELEASGLRLQGNRFVGRGERYLPLYEAKMMQQFTHRWATYAANGKTRALTAGELRNPDFVVMPRYWVHEKEVAAKSERWHKQWFLGFRSITNTTNERTVIASVIPYAAVSGKLPLIMPEAAHPAALLSNLNSFALDFVARQKVGGTDLSFFTLKQLPVLPPHTYKPSQAKPSQAKPSQAKPSQAKPSQAKPSQAKPSQAKPSQAKNIRSLGLHPAPRPGIDLHRLGLTGFRPRPGL